jgi:hypothetical protein
VNASNWLAAVSGIASMVSGFSGGAATSREEGSGGSALVSASGWSIGWGADGARGQNNSFFGFPGRPWYQHSRPSMMR